MHTRPLALDLAEFVASFDLAAAPPETTRRVTELIADAIGCGLGAGALPWGQQLQRAAHALAGREEPGTGPAVLGSGAAAAVAPTAAMNALLINCMDYDDTHFGHPGAIVVAVALAVGHAADSSYRDLIEAAMLGYEVAGRVAAASNPSPAGRNTAWGTGLRFAPAAAAVAGKLLGLEPPALAHALALAACDGPVPSVRQTVYGPSGPTMAKNNYAAAANAGVTAAYLAREGVTGPLDIFDSAQGFATLAGSDRWQPQELLSGTTHVLQVDSKPYSCCRKIHASLDAVGELQDEHDFSHGDVLEVTLTSPGWSAGGCFANPAPQQMVDVQFSAAFCAAMMLHRVPTGAEWFGPSRLRDNSICATAGRIRLAACDTAEASTHPFWTHVSIRTTSGVHELTVPAPRGSATNPMTHEQLRAKFTQLVTPVLGVAPTADLYDSLLGRRVENTRDLNVLIGNSTAAADDRSSTLQTAPRPSTGPRSSSLSR